MKTITVSGLNVYPVKSCKGIPLKSATVGPLGIQHDRQWMFIDEKGNFVAQRNYKKIGSIAIKSLHAIETYIDPKGLLVLTAPSMPVLMLPLEGYAGVTRIVHVWDSTFEAIDQGAWISGWATEYLSREVPGQYSIVRVPDNGNRIPKHGEGKLACADGYPFLMLSDASLADLNSRMDEPLPVDRFRPNIMLAGCQPYEEDTMPDFKIGDVGFTGMGLCVRCPITTTDQITGVRNKEPLATLATYRHDREQGGVVFARNFNHRGTGIISLGDQLVF